MPAFDWPLTTFTLITQVVLGAFAVLWVTDLFARQLAEPAEQEHLTRVAVWLLGPLMAIGFAASTLHLGQPLFAYRAISNVSSSWLSREIVFLGSFFAAGGGYALLWWRRRSAFTLRAVLGVVVGMLGALGLVSMTMLYMVPAMPTWARPSTPIAFVGSALLLGPLLVAAVFTTTARLHRRDAQLEPLVALHVRSAALTCLAALVLVAGGLVWSLVSLPGAGVEADASWQLATGDHRLLLGVRITLLVLGALGVVALLVRLLRGASVRAVTAHVWVLLGVLTGSEVLGRVLFYATAVPLRPPGPFL